MTVLSESIGLASKRRRARVGVHTEVMILGALFAAQLLLRGMALFNHRVDSDEPQHLHVIWGWSQGLVQYRDVFDNHAPLFHLLLAPAIRLLGERADIILVARILLLPLVALSLWATYRLGSLLWSPRTGAWAALTTGFSPTWLLVSSEFRADILWMAAWMCALVALLGAPLSPRRGFVGGLLLGAALVTSLKTVLLLTALALALGVVVVLRRFGRGSSWPENGARALAMTCAGFLVLPTVIVVWFWWLGALGPMRYCTLDHNVVPRLGHWGSESIRPWIVPGALLALVLLAHRVLRHGDGVKAQGRRVTLVLATGCFISLLEGAWPLITREDYLPWVPTLALIAVAGIRWVWGCLRSRTRSNAVAWGFVCTLSLIAAIEVFSVFEVEPIWRHQNDPQVQLLGEVLRLTRPHESIMDLKGETVFRPRPYYFALEGVTKARIAFGLLPDRIASDVQRARTHFATRDDVGFPSDARKFLNAHFLPAGAMRVLGSDLGRGTRISARPFDVIYDDRFAILADGRPGRGSLDGSPYRAARELEPGPHVYVPTAGEDHVIVVWAGVLHRTPGALWASRHLAS